MEISFFEAFFKVHYTKGFKLTYPAPLPTTVAGMFGAILGVDRKECKEVFMNSFFGAKLLGVKGDFSENTTFMQYKEKEVIKGVAETIILNNPTYLIAMVDEDEVVEDFHRKMCRRIVYLPYGGQNDFFVENIKILNPVPLEKSLLIENYAPQDLVEKVEMVKDTQLQILPVKHKFSKNPNFYFVFNGKLRLKEEIPSVQGIGLYSLNMFEYLTLY